MVPLIQFHVITGEHIRVFRAEFTAGTIEARCRAKFGSMVFRFASPIRAEFGLEFGKEMVKKWRHDGKAATNNAASYFGKAKKLVSIDS